MTDTNQTKAKAKKEQLADHGLLDAAGAVTKDMQVAQSITYNLKDLPGEVVTYTYGNSPDGDRMLALFGAKTLATNESSQARQKLGTTGTEQQQIAWVRERFGLLETGQWVDKTREGFSRAWDKDILADIIVASAAANGKTVDVAAIRAKLDSDEQWYKDCQLVPQYADEYRKQTNKPVKAVSDILAGL